MTALAPFTEPQVTQLHVLRVRGWTLHITERHDISLAISVAGTDQADRPITGTIDARGVLVGQPADPALAPARFGVGAPAEVTG